MTKTSPSEGKHEKTGSEKRSSILKSIRNMIINILVAVLIAFLITLLVRPTIVVETSMMPNIHPKDYLFISRISYRNGKIPEKGDVIVFRSDLETESGSKKLLIKRVIGLPGDVIDIRDGEVYINGVRDDQSYTQDGITPGEVDHYTVPEGTVYCLGDNRVVSRDSRDETVGPIPLKRIVGKAVFRLYRFSAIGPIENPYDKDS